MASTSNTSASHPSFIYGTAWKKDQTKRLVKEAIIAGFRRVDTAAQPRHYQEHLVGEALRELYSSGIVTRSDLHIQTKYTTPAGQDLTNMPYDPSAPLATQISTSVTSSLANLRHTDDTSSESTTYVDCLLLHSPLPTIDQTLQAWALLESYVPHHIRTLGISNVTLPILQTIYESSTVKPSVVQNRFYPQTGYDVALRAFCRDKNITYQSFWTLTGNPALLKSRVVGDLAKGVGVGKEVALYALVGGLRIEVLNGTTDGGHMREDLEGLEMVRMWKGKNGEEWDGFVREFMGIVGEG